MIIYNAIKQKSMNVMESYKYNIAKIKQSINEKRNEIWKGKLPRRWNPRRYLRKEWRDNNLDIPSAYPYTHGIQPKHTKHKRLIEREKINK